MCAKYVGGGRQAADEFHFEDVELECVGKFVYLGDMLNDTGRVEQAVAGSLKRRMLRMICRVTLRDKSCSW